ncbi:MAG: tRNA (adenosine(37)-N6)-threonylcarbamoyltransferase complex transferase subunit TsaD [Puniceicoccales bacterium]|jgi:N6-L-threonylcarbamoyladenine synthase|nr:tRNA (adenosine(37)-N6)-threonylcarbamoyltransferase complex transferase subunit TsaD [Puniceicoccales bacterium]
MIIGIESSCDESAIAIFDEDSGVVFEKISSQVNLHTEYGGVVPELASREHVKNFIPLLKDLKNFGISGAKLIAVTREPGLPGCINIGLAVARALSLILRLPVREINHLHGHLFSPFIPIHAHAPQSFFSNLKEYLPHLGLLVSGGNTILFEVSEDLATVTIAETQDDAAGEAFDKGAKLLGLPYPGGHLIERLARLGNAKKYQFPRAFLNKSDMKFSFSGLKTSLRYFLEKFEGSFASHINDICASYQEAIVDTLSIKVSHALGKHSFYKSIGISGGVSNNDTLREKISTLAAKFGKKFVFPLRHHTGDNAAMIAFAAYVYGNFSNDYRR